MNRGMIKTLDVVSSFGVAAIGGWLVYASLVDEELNTKVHDYIGNTPLFGAAVGGFLILSVILRIASSRKRVDKGSFINLQSDEGGVGVSTKAIKDFIERVGEEFDAVKSIESELIEQKGKLDIAVSVKLVSGNRIPELSSELQQRIRESVCESLGLDEIRNITIQISEIVGKPEKHTDNPPEEPDPVEPDPVEPDPKIIPE